MRTVRVQSEHCGEKYYTVNELNGKYGCNCEAIKYGKKVCKHMLKAMKTDKEWILE